MDIRRLSTHDALPDSPSTMPVCLYILPMHYMLFPQPYIFYPSTCILFPQPYIFHPCTYILFP